MNIFNDKRFISKILYLSLGFYSIMIFLFILHGKTYSGYFSNVFSMNAENMRSFLSAIYDNGGLTLFSCVFILDYFFFAFLGCFFFFRLKAQSKCVRGKLQNITSFMAYFGFSSIIADGIETTILQYMIHHHKDFPDYLVNIQTPFTILALIMDFTSIFWIIFIFFKKDKPTFQMRTRPNLLP